MPISTGNNSFHREYLEAVEDGCVELNDGSILPQGGGTTRVQSHLSSHKLEKQMK